MLERLTIILAMGLAIGIIFLEQSGVGVTLEAMAAQLHLSAVASHWVMNAYIITLAALMLGGGRIGDLIGPKKAFLAGLLVFAISSLICGLSHSFESLLIGRIVQGVGASLTMPNTFSLVRHEFTEGNVGKVIGICVAFGSFFLATGPLIGGSLTEFANWRFIFLINLPLASASFICVLISLKPKYQLPDKIEFDFIGFIIFALALLGITISLMELPQWGFSTRFFELFLGGLILAACFILIEKRTKKPIFDLKLFKKTRFIVPVMILFMIQMILLCYVFRAMWFERALGFSPAMAGLALMPSTIPVMFMAPLVGAWNDKHDMKYALRLGTSLLSASLCWITVMAYFENYWLLLPAIIVSGIAIPMVINTAVLMVVSNVDLHQTGMATGMSNTIRQVGGAMAFAIIGTVMILSERGFHVLHLTPAFTLAFCVMTGITAILALISCGLSWRFV